MGQKICHVKSYLSTHFFLFGNRFHYSIKKVATKFFLSFAENLQKSMTLVRFGLVTISKRSSTALKQSRTVGKTFKKGIFKRELRVLALLGIEKLLGGRILSPGSANFRVLRLVKFVYEFCK